jgi:hypothetical protein
METVVRDLYQEVVSLRHDVQMLRSQEMAPVGFRHVDRVHGYSVRLDGSSIGVIPPVTPAGWFVGGEFIYWHSPRPVVFENMSPPMPPPAVIHPFGPTGVYIAIPPGGLEGNN